MNTLLQLNYADASNHKKDIELVLEGEITVDQIATIASKLNEGESIIAHQVGLPTPSEKFDEDFDFPTADDHVWTDIEAFSYGNPSPKDMLTDKEPNFHMTISEFVEKMKAVEEWDIGAEMERLDIPDY